MAVLSWAVLPCITADLPRVPVPFLRPARRGPTVARGRSAGYCSAKLSRDRWFRRRILQSKVGQYCEAAV